MHNVTADQIEKNKQLIKLVRDHPQIYNHDPATQQQSNESVEEIWAKIGNELQDTPESCKKKWRLLRSSLIRYIKVFKDKSTSKGNRYRPYYLLEHMDFLLPYIDDKNIIRKVKPVMKSPNTTTVVLKKPRPDEDTILYTSTPNTITYSVQTVASSSKDASQEHLKAESQQQAQDIQQFYNHAGSSVKIIGEDYITTYPSGEQLIYQTSGQTVEEIQQQQQECLQQQHEVEQNELSVQQDSPTKQQLANATIIPIPNVSNVFSSTNPNEASDLYFLIGLLPDFRNLSHDTKRKVKINILKLLDDAVSQ